MISVSKRTFVRLMARALNCLLLSASLSISMLPARALTVSGVVTTGVASERSALVDAAVETGADKSVVEKFLKDAAAFESRLSDPQEIADTYVNVRSLLSDKSEKNTTSSEKLALAAQVVSQAANPLEINQGRHNTCAIAALESRTYTLHPSSAALLLSEVARTGKFVLPDGRAIVLDAENLHPDREASSRGYAIRSYASQLFQLTVANIYWQSKAKDPRGLDCGIGHIRYVQKPASTLYSADTGERLQIHWEDGVVETVVEDSGRPIMQPCFTLSDVQEVAQLVSPSAHDGTFVIAGSKFDKRQKYIPVRSVSDLRNKLSSLKQQAKLPLVAAVDSGKSWLANDPHLRHLPGGWYTFDVDKNAGNASEDSNKSGLHAICITAFDETNDTVSIDNFWGPVGDHTGANAIKVTELYEAIASN